MISRDEFLAFCERPVHVVGAASAEGVAVTQLLMRLGFTDIVVHDQRTADELRKGFRTVHGAYSRVAQDELWEALRPVRERGHFADDYLSGLSDAAVVVLGQGWRLDEANRTGIEAGIADGTLVTSMTELYFAFAPGPIAAITGTNGKSTTVALADHLLAYAGVEHRTAGNERTTPQFLGGIVDLPAGMLSLLEISNRQLDQVDRPRINVAAITSLTPDHLDEHGGWDGYRAVKCRAFAGQQATDIAIVNADSATCVDAARASAGTLVACGIGAHDAPSVSWLDGQLVHLDADGSRTVLASLDDLTLPGDHNLRNAAIAAALALSCGASPDTIAGGLRSFVGKSLRLERVDSIGDVDVFSDVKSTTPEATIAALQALEPRRIVLIAGGSDKGLDYTELGARIVAQGVRTLLVPGDATDKLERAIAAGGGSSERVALLDEALDAALSDPGAVDVVIVSPAAAGFWTTQLQGRPSLKSLVRSRAQSQQEATPT